MASSYAPSTTKAAQASSVPSLTRLYLVDNGSEYEFRTSGPADASLTLNGDGQYEVDVASTARLAKAADGSLVVY